MDICSYLYNNDLTKLKTCTTIVSNPIYIFIYLYINQLFTFIKVWFHVHLCCCLRLVGVNLLSVYPSRLHKIGIRALILEIKCYLSFVFSFYCVFSHLFVLSLLFNFILLFHLLLFYFFESIFLF